MSRWLLVLWIRLTLLWRLITYLMLSNPVIMIVSVVLGVMRVAGIKHSAFQAFAHLFVGGLFASGYTELQFAFLSRNAMFRIKVATALSILELVCAIVFLINK
jgi:hypothetical protein